MTATHDANVNGLSILMSLHSSLFSDSLSLYNISSLLLSSSACVKETILLSSEGESSQQIRFFKEGAKGRTNEEISCIVSILNE